jgi:hypothetical protein
MGGGGLAKMSHDKFLLVISQVKVCHITQGGGGRLRRNVVKCHTVGGGPGGGEEGGQKCAEKMSPIT